jgi:hypothetical protein
LAIFADLVLLNGEVLTMDSVDTLAEAVAIKDGKIVNVGTNEEIVRMAGEGTKVIDLEGKTVVPGFIDAHQHLSMAAEAFVSVNCGPETVKSISEIMERIRERAHETTKGEWIKAFGYDDTLLAEKRHPNRWDLDKATTEHPVILTHVGSHTGVLNSKGLELANITKGAPDPVGGRIERDPKTGEPTGVVHEAALTMLTSTTEGKPPIIPPLKKKELIKGIKQLIKEYVKAGLTSIVDAWVLPTAIEAYIELLKRNELPIRVYMAIWYEYLPELKVLRLLTGFGNDYLRIGPIKIVVDGAVTGRTAALCNPYTDKPNYYGILAIDLEKLTEVICEAHKAGFQIAVHANGDRAIDFALKSFEKAFKNFPRKNHRHRIEHCSVVNRGLIERIKRLEIIPILFAAYPYYHGDKLISAFGSERVPWLMAYRSFLDEGVKVASHSDFPCSPYSPLLGMHSIVNRVTMEGKLFGPEQRVTPKEALRTYTTYAVYSTFEENVKGSVEPGKLADLVVLSENPLKIPPEKIKEIQVETTIIGGKIVYRRKIKKR